MNQWEQKGNIWSSFISPSLFFSLSFFPWVFSQEEIIGTAPRPVGRSSFIFSHKNTSSHWASRLRPQKRQKSLLSQRNLPHSCCSSQQLDINPCCCGKEIIFLPIPPLPHQVHSGISPSRPWLLEVPYRSSWTSFVLHACCSRKRPPRWLLLKEAFYQYRARSPLFLEHIIFTLWNQQTWRRGWQLT